MKTVSLTIVVSVLIFTLHGFKRSPGTQEIVTPGELKGWIDYLASDNMRGRANGSPEMKIAAGWLSDHFKEFGLLPVLPDGNYIQNYTATARQQTVNEKNVIGIINGTDPRLKDQYIVLSAHFDHIGVIKGIGPDSICNGADDNAAGTCTLLGIAKTIRESGLKPGRTIVFAAFSGEELGMRGSRYFVANSPVPLKNIYADLNFEMTGHSEFLGRNHYYMTGCRFSNLDDLIGEYNRNSDWKLIDTIKIANSLYYASDNIAFSRISNSENITYGIPGGTFATTALSGYLHTPGDEGKLFDYENMAGLVRYFSDLVIWLSKSNMEVRFTDPAFARTK
jgi:hypothetical protein